MAALGAPAFPRRIRPALLSNQLLVALARPDATFVAGFKAWLDLGYCVRKGEKAIRIIAPMPVNERSGATERERRSAPHYPGAPDRSVCANVLTSSM